MNKSSKAFDIHFLRHINLSTISYMELQRVLQSRTSDNSLFCSNSTYFCKTSFFTGFFRNIFTTFRTFLSIFSISRLKTGTSFDAIVGSLCQNLLHTFLCLNHRRNLYLQYELHFCFCITNTSHTARCTPCAQQSW